MVAGLQIARTVCGMTLNQSPTKRPSARNPRARSAAGANPPNIARDVTLVVTSAETVVSVLTCCDASTPVVVTALLPMLQRHMDKSLQDVLSLAAKMYAEGHGCVGADGEMVAQAVRERLEGIEVTDHLDDVIAAYVSEGIDAEKVTWDVITRESANHEGLIYKECNRLLRSLPNRRVDELKGYGWVGLRTALRNFDLSLGYAFSTYACPRINGAIRDGVRAESPIPKRLTTFVRKVSSAEELLTHQLSRTPTYEEISEYLAAEERTMKLLPRLTPAMSLEEMALGPDGEPFREPACLVDDHTPLDSTLTTLRDEALHRAISELPAEQEEAIRLLMLEEMPVGVAAKKVGVPPRQMSQRRQRALKALAPVMQAWFDENEIPSPAGA